VLKMKKINNIAIIRQRGCGGCAPDI